MIKEISYKNSKTILTPTGGFLSGYTHSLNPYIGCSFACSYCYVRQMPVSLFRSGKWGEWVDVKQGIKETLSKDLIRAKKKGPVTIFMSSSTDPYQPVEYKEKVTRSVLEVLVQEKPDFLFVQTRSPLVVRDIDLFQQISDRILISITIETDLESIRKKFSPAAPPIQARFKAVKEICLAGLPAQAAVAPFLPSSYDFPKKLREIVTRVCIDDYYRGDGSGGKRTKRLGIDNLYNEINQYKWYEEEAFQEIISRFKNVFSEKEMFISQKGFMPL